MADKKSAKERKKIVILGSTGSIGRSTLEIVELYPELYEVIGLSARSNVSLLAEQAVKFKPKYVAIADSRFYCELRDTLSSVGTEVLSGIEGLIKLATLEEADLIMAAIVGSPGLIPTFSAIKEGKKVALANKETIVIAGEIVMKVASKSGAVIIPVDSEHSAIFQCLQGRDLKEVNRIILTSSGGPFRNFTYSQMKEVSREQALNHPTWKMGSKITIDSATLMNKGFEIIEAKWLFGMPAEKIDILIHPQSIVHALIELVDGSLLAHLALPDMKVPISYALAYPDRLKLNQERLSMAKIAQLSFEEPDIKRFPALRLAKWALLEGDGYPAVLAGANDKAVELFLAGKISFLKICELVERVMERFSPQRCVNIEDVICYNEWALNEVERLMQ